jgi:hypothetical protein
LNILRENQIIFSTYGPSGLDSKNPLSDFAHIWRDQVKACIIPNNTKIIGLLEQNKKLLTEDEKIILEKYKIHSYDFEFNHLSGCKRKTSITFPNEIHNILS